MSKKMGFNLFFDKFIAQALHAFERRASRVLTSKANHRALFGEFIDFFTF